MSFVQIPRLLLPTDESAERLRKRWAESKAKAERDRFWWDVQQKRQRLLIQDQPDYGEPEFYGPIG